MKSVGKRAPEFLMALLVVWNMAFPVWAGDSGAWLEYGRDSYVNSRSFGEEISEDGQAPAVSQSLSGEDANAPVWALEELDISNAEFVSVAEAEEQLRDHMKDRDTRFSLYIRAEDGVPDMRETLFPAACSEALATGVNTGDYLLWSWSSCNWEYRIFTGGRYVFLIEMTYYSDAAQEREFLQTLSDVLEELDLWQKSSYEKYCGIYDYITSHVSMAYEELESGDLSVYSAYGALVKGKAVCQGYATLFYAMCRSMGLPVRIITGNNHAWNIVNLDGLYYNVDATWDGQDQASGRNYFLLGSENFQAHNASEEYRTDEFLAAYPLSQTDYAPRMLSSGSGGSFADVPTSSYYYSAIENVTERGLFQGTGPTTFEPEGTMDRAMLVTVLWRMAGSPGYGTDSGFQDVPANAYYARAVAWAREKGIANGVSSTDFGPGQKLTREQAAVFLYRYASAMGYQTNAFDNLSAYRDVSTAGSYAIPALRWAVGAGIINGIGNAAIAPKGSATRGQMAVMLTRFLNHYGI